jgi:hypothetical protein
MLLCTYIVYVVNFVFFLSYLVIGLRLTSVTLAATIIRSKQFEISICYHFVRMTNGLRDLISRTISSGLPLRHERGQ